MHRDILACRLRTLRQRSGLTQRELAQILGSVNKDAVSRHERSITLPSFSIALAYECVFRVPAAELFPRLQSTVEQGIEQRIRQFEQKLHQSTAKGRVAAETARKLEFCCERRETPPKSPST